MCQGRAPTRLAERDISGPRPQARDQFLAPDQGTGPLNQEFENLKCLLRQALAHAAALDVRGGEIKDRIAEANLARGSGDLFTANGGSADVRSQSVKIQTRDRDSPLNDAAPACTLLPTTLQSAAAAATVL